MKKKEKLKKIIKKLTNLDSGVVDTFKSLDQEMAKISAKLKETYTDKTLTKVDAEFKTLYKSFSTVADSLDKIQNDIAGIESSLSSELGEKYAELKKLVDETSIFSQKNTTDVGNQANKRIDALKTIIERLGGDIQEVGRSRTEDIPMIRREIQNSAKDLKNIIERIQEEAGKYSTDTEAFKLSTKNDAEKLAKDLEELREELRKKFTAIGSMDRGGSINRRTLVDGTNYLTKYTDINLVSGNNVTLGVANNDTLQTTDITINSTGGGGGGGSSYFVAQTPDDGTYGLLSGTVNGTNTTFTTPEGQYVSGSLVVFLRGKLQIQGASYDWVETTPDSGIFDFNTPPLVGDDVTAMYLTTSGGGGGSAGGSDTNVQFNDGGSLNGSNRFTFDKNTNTMSVTNIASSVVGISSTLTINSLTALRAVATDTDKNIVSSPTTYAELAYLGGVTSSVVSINNIQTLTNKTLVTPSIASFAQAQHNHQDGVGGGLLNGSSVFSMIGGQIQTSVLGTGTASTSTFLRGDNTWATPTATPGGANQQIQFNDGGTFGGSSIFTWDKNSSILQANKITSSVFLSSKAVITDASSVLATSHVSATELGYLSSVTSAIQPQINSKASIIQVFDWNPFFNGTVVSSLFGLILDTSFGGTINSLSAKTNVGEASIVGLINTTPLGAAVMSASSVLSSVLVSSSNTFVAGDTISLNISSVASVRDLSFKIKYTRTLQ